MRALCIRSCPGTHGMRALRIRYPNKKPHTYVCGQKKKDFLSEVLVLALPIFTAWASYRRAVRNSPWDCCRRMLPARIKKKDFLSEVLVLALPIFTARRQATIVGVSELNFCVRDGNRWTLTTINTNSHRMALHHPLY